MAQEAEACIAEVESTPDVISSATADLLNRSPSAFVAVMGNFNHTNLSIVFPTFKQYVDCKTKDNKTLDLLYSSATDAYTCISLPFLGRADHTLVHLQSFYKPAVQRQPATIKMVRRWTRELKKTLQGCFEATDSDLLCDSQGGQFRQSDKLCYGLYQLLCGHCGSPPPKKKHSLLPPQSTLGNQRHQSYTEQEKIVFTNCEKENLKLVQKELKTKAAEGKQSNRRKLESKLQENNTR